MEEEVGDLVWFGAGGVGFEGRREAKREGKARKGKCGKPATGSDGGAQGIFGSDRHRLVWFFLSTVQ